MLLFSPNQVHGASRRSTDPTRAPHLGWPAPRCRTEAHARTPAQGASSGSPGALGRASGARDAPGGRCDPLPPVLSCLPGRPPRPCRVLAREFPDPRVLDPGQPRSSDRRGRAPTGTLGWSPRPRHPARPRRQPRAWPPRAGLVRPVPCPGPDHAARGAPCARVRPDEFPEASETRDRNRSVLVSSVVRRVAGAARSGWHRPPSRRGPAQLAGAHRMAAIWPARDR